MGEKRCLVVGKAAAEWLDLAQSRGEAIPNNDVSRKKAPGGCFGQQPQARVHSIRKFRRGLDNRAVDLK